MGVFASLLTVLFIGLKLTGSIAWSWFLVLLPMVLYLGFVVTIFGALVAVKVREELEDRARRERLKARRAKEQTS